MKTRRVGPSAQTVFELTENGLNWESGVAGVGWFQKIAGQKPG